MFAHELIQNFPVFKIDKRKKQFNILSRAAVVHLNFRAGSTFPIPVWSVPSSIDRTSRCNKVKAVRLCASNRLNLFLLKGKRCVLYCINQFYLSQDIYRPFIRWKKFYIFKISFFFIAAEICNLIEFLRRGSLIINLVYCPVLPQLYRLYVVNVYCTVYI